MATWKVQNLRVTGFVPTIEPVRVDEVWSELVGAPAERVDQRPKEGVAAAMGPFEGATLTLSAAPQRLDLLWVVDESAAIERASIGDYGVIETPFIALAKKWLSRSKAPLNRVAWGGVMDLPAQSKQEGYKTLNGFLPDVKLDPVGSADFLYRINRPRPSKVLKGLRINRLSTWALVATRTVNLQVAAAVQPAGARTTAVLGPESNACRLQFDVNTDPTREEPFAQDVLPELLDELAGLAAEIADKGDIS